MLPDVSWVRLEVAVVPDKLQTIRCTGVIYVWMKRELDCLEIANYAYNYLLKRLFHRSYRSKYDIVDNWPNLRLCPC